VILHFEPEIFGKAFAAKQKAFGKSGGAKPVEAGGKKQNVAGSVFLQRSGFYRRLRWAGFAGERFPAAPAFFLPNWAKSLALRGQPRKSSKLGITTNQRCCFPESPERAAHRPRRGNSTGTMAQSLDLALHRLELGL